MSGRLARFIAPALAMASVAWSAGAGAQCGAPPAITVSPADDAPAPRNTHVKLTLPRGWQLRRIECLVAVADPPRDCAGVFRLAVRTAAVSGALDSDVVIDERDVDRGRLAEVELTPRALLEADARYEIWLVDDTARARSRILGTFVTARTTDDAPPSWRGLARATFDRGGAAAPECMTEPSLELLVDAAQDLPTPAPRLRYAIWIGDAGGTAVDYARPAAANVRAWNAPALDRLQLGGDGLLDFDFSALHGARIVGVRAVDAAGNASAPSEATVDFGGGAQSACADSADCAAGDVCCEVRSSSSERTPFAHVVASAKICSANPRQDCYGVELCHASTCRISKPTPARGSSAECHAQRDCPEGAQCVLFSFTTVSAACLYNPTLEHADTAPVCSSNAECDALFPRWRAFAGDDDRAKTWPGRCAPVHGDPAHRSACVMPWTRGR